MELAYLVPKVNAKLKLNDFIIEHRISKILELSVIANKIADRIKEKHQFFDGNDICIPEDELQRIILEEIDNSVDFLLENITTKCTKRLENLD